MKSFTCWVRSKLRYGNIGGWQRVILIQEILEDLPHSSVSVAGMKTTRLFFFTVVLWSQALNSNADELVTLVVPPFQQGVTPDPRYSDTITLAAGDSAKAVYCSFTGSLAMLELTIGALTYDIPTSISAQNTPIGIPIIAGPAAVRVKVGSSLSGPLTATFSISRANSVANVIPANAAVIPEDASGQFQVILESSIDLLNWAAANPGTYGGSTAKRFFRTRIARIN